MLTGSLITIREGLEAFLIIGILLGYLTKVNQPRLKTFVWIGASAAILLSALLAAAFQLLAIQFEGVVEEIFEAAVALLAVGVLTWMVLWMQRQSRGIKGELEHKVDLALSRGQAYGLAGLAFVTVLREGLETALFLSAIYVSARGDDVFLGALLGLAIAAGITYLIFRSSIRLNLRAFFTITGSFLIVIAAGLVGHSIMALQEAGWLSIGTTTAWNIGWLISNDGFLGRLLHAFTGYEAAPSVLVVIAYLAYVIVFGTKFIRALQPGSMSRSV
jgi:high-affinity iron transporter